MAHFGALVYIKYCTKTKLEILRRQYFIISFDLTKNIIIAMRQQTS